MREQEYSPEPQPTEGIRILRAHWIPEALPRLAQKILQVLHSGHPNNMSEADREILSEINEHMASIETEWLQILHEFYPLKRMEATYVMPPRRSKKNKIYSDQTWHQDGVAMWSKPLDAQLVLWSNREATEVRNRDTKQTIVLPSSAIFTVDNGLYEHRRPPSESPDRFLCHAAVWPDESQTTDTSS